MNLSTNTPTMTSREIAELTGKEHKHVMRDIRNLMEELNESNFGPVDYTDAKGEKRPQYVLDKDMTLTLISGYRADLRYKIVKRWRELEEQHQKTLTPLDVMAQQIAYLQEIEKRQAETQARVQQVEHQLDQISTATEYMTVVGWSRLKGRGPVDSRTAAGMGRRASAVCREQGFEVGVTTHPLWGQVNTYPERVLDQLFGGAA